MLDQLSANQGQKIVIELANGRKISGIMLSANQQYLRLQTDEGIGNIPMQAVCVVWEAPAQTLTREHMDEIAEKMRDSVKEHIACTSFPGFTCSRSYICRPPDTCTYSFACPGSYVPSLPSGGGGCPLFACGPFQFGQPCTFAFQCRPFTFGQPCGPFQFGQPCAPFQFGQPCSPFVFGQPCSPFVFGGSQCGAVGGFICPGQQFFGVAPGGGGSQCGVAGGFACPGQQFIGVAGPPGPPQPMGSTTQQNPPLSPLDFSVKLEGKNEDDKKE